MEDESGADDPADRRKIHAPGQTQTRLLDDPNRMLVRRSPVGQSRSGLASHDYHPRAGGPELMASWPLGPSPTQPAAAVEDWTITSSSFVVLQANFLQLPYLGPIDYSPLYLNVMGAGEVEENETLTLQLANEHLSGKPYEGTIELTDSERQLFVIPMIEIAPETDDHGPLGKEYARYELRAKVSGGEASVDPGTTVQLWSE